MFNRKSLYLFIFLKMQDLLLFFLGLIQFILLDVSSGMRDALGYFSAIEHMGTYSRGIVDTRPIVFYLSMTAFVLTVTYQVFQSRKWRL